MEHKAQLVYHARRYFGLTFVQHITSSIFIYIQTGNNDCCPQYVVPQLVYFGTVPRAENHEMDHQSLKQYSTIWGALIVPTVVKMP